MDPIHGRNDDAERPGAEHFLEEIAFGEQLVLVVVGEGEVLESEWRYFALQSLL